MSFLADPPMLVASGVAIERVARDERTARVAGRAVVATFLVTSIGLYVEAPFTRWLWRLCRARSGRDWMLNSGVFSFDERAAGARTHLASAAIFATYPLWLRVGRKLATRPA